MSYVALYRKWRPDEFDEVKGQEHIVTTLKNQITHDRIGHAYLFCGTRGTGKTTVAKLFAKAVNCEHPLEDGSPCNDCAMCKAIGMGNSLSVIEFDAASNSGVDNIREIRDEVQYSPSEGKYKVYIIDEAHQLTSEAWNAMLKTLEEPPSYVIFIFATTESHKIPITIKSRCQRYDFRRIGIETIYQRLTDLLEREGVEAEEKAIRYVAKAADGSMRDALSLLDQCIAFYLGQKLTYDKVLEILGAVDVDVFNQLMGYIVTNHTMQALKVIDDIIWQGGELGQFVVDFTWYMRNLLLLKSADDMQEQLDISMDKLESMKAVASQVEMESLMRYIRVFSEMTNQIRYATQKRVLLEVAIIKLTTPQMETNMDSVLDRIRLLEQKVEEGVFSLSEEQMKQMGQNMAARAEQTAEAVPESPDIDREETIKKELTKAQASDMKMIMDGISEIRHNPDLRREIGIGTMSLFDKASVNIGSDKQSIVLTFDQEESSQMAATQFSKENHLAALQELVGELTGKQVEITCQSKNDLKETDLGSINLSKVNFDVVVEE